MEKVNLLLILTGKTASGKDTVMKQLLSRFPNLKRVVTTTSRPPREGEKNGIDYNFVSKEDFKRKITAGDFIEYVEYAGNLYGTEKAQLKTTNDLIWRIDPSRAGKVKGLVIYLTVSDEVVLQRLKDRGLSQGDIIKRMEEDKRFWQAYKDNYDFVVENTPGKLDETLDKIIKIIENHRLARSILKGLSLKDTPLR